MKAQKIVFFCLRISGAQFECIVPDLSIQIDFHILVHLFISNAPPLRRVYPSEQKQFDMESERYMKVTMVSRSCRSLVEGAAAGKVGLARVRWGSKAILRSDDARIEAGVWGRHMVDFGVATNVNHVVRDVEFVHAITDAGGKREGHSAGKSVRTQVGVSDLRPGSIGYLTIDVGSNHPHRSKFLEAGECAGDGARKPGICNVKVHQLWARRSHFFRD